MLLRRVEEEDVEGEAEEEAAEEVEVEGGSQYRRAQYFLRAEKKSRRHQRKARQPKALVFLQVQVGTQESVTVPQEKMAET